MENSSSRLAMLLIRSVNNAKLIRHHIRQDRHLDRHHIHLDHRGPIRPGRQETDLDHRRPLGQRAVVVAVVVLVDLPR